MDQQPRQRYDDLEWKVAQHELIFELGRIANLRTIRPSALIRSDTPSETEPTELIATQSLSEVPCDDCRRLGRRCEKQLPRCGLCQRTGRDCKYSVRKRQAPNRKRCLQAQHSSISAHLSRHQSQPTSLATLTTVKPQEVEDSAKIPQAENRSSAADSQGLRSSSGAEPKVVPFKVSVS